MLILDRKKRSRRLEKEEDLVRMMLKFKEATDLSRTKRKRFAKVNGKRVKVMSEDRNITRTMARVEPLLCVYVYDS